MMQALADYYSIVDHAGMFLDLGQQAQIKSAVDAFLANYSYLASKSMRAGLVRYSVVYKHHYFAHVPELAKSINPRIVATYTEESMCGRGAKLYNHGAFQGRTQQSVLAKYLVAMQLKLTPGLCW